MYGTDTILILGKGPSVDEIDPACFSGKLIISLNDAERITPSDITIFHADWVKESVTEAGLKSQLYVTSTDFEPQAREVAHVPYEPLRNDTADLMMQRFMGDDLVIEEVMFLTALKIARRISRMKGRQQTVYMVGFDFQPQLGFSEAVSPSYQTEAEDERYATIAMQEYFFVHTLYMLSNSDEVEVKHVGSRPFSSLTPAEFNDHFRPAPTHVDTRAQAVNHVDVVAELTTNHFGDRHRLERLVRAAKAAGADYVKLQKRDVETFYTPEQLDSPYVSPFGDTFGDYRRALELEHDDFVFVDELCRELGIDWFVSVLDEPSFWYMLELEPPMIKLPSTISEHRSYLAHVAESYTGPIVLSTGMTDQSYEEWVLDTFQRQDQIYLLHCNSAYPTPSHHCNIGVVRHYHELSLRHPQIVPGYSSHDTGWMASALAVAAGARMVEKHVKLGTTEWAHFDAVAMDLTTSEFNEYVDAIRRAQVVVGTDYKHITDSEHHKYIPHSQEERTG